MIQRILLPRITRTTVARQSIRSHHLSLLRRLTTSMGSLKESQAESYAALPRPDPYRETSQFNACHSIVDVLTALGDKKPDTDNLPPISLIRCGIEEYGKGKAGDQTKPSTEELFQLLEDRVPWLVSEEGLVYEVSFSQSSTSRSMEPFYSKNFGKPFPLALCSPKLLFRHPQMSQITTETISQHAGHILHCLPKNHLLS